MKMNSPSPLNPPLAARQRSEPRYPALLEVRGKKNVDHRPEAVGRMRPLFPHGPEGKTPPDVAGQRHVSGQRHDVVHRVEALDEAVAVGEQPDDHEGPRRPGERHHELPVVHLQHVAEGVREVHGGHLRGDEPAVEQEQSDDAEHRVGDLDTGITLLRTVTGVLLTIGTDVLAGDDHHHESPGKQQEKPDDEHGRHPPLFAEQPGADESRHRLDSNQRTPEPPGVQEETVTGIVGMSVSAMRRIVGAVVPEEPRDDDTAADDEGQQYQHEDQCSVSHGISEMREEGRLRG